MAKRYMGQEGLAKARLRPIEAGLAEEPKTLATPAEGAS